MEHVITTAPADGSLSKQRGQTLVPTTTLADSLPLGQVITTTTTNPFQVDIGSRITVSFGDHLLTPMITLTQSAMTSHIPYSLKFSRISRIFVWP